jgi:hypothetical protein
MITDGAIHKQLDLDINELQNGSIVYTPATDDAVLRLEIVTPESTNPITESVRLVAGAVPLLPFQTQTRHHRGPSRTTSTNREVLVTSAAFGALVFRTSCSGPRPSRRHNRAGHADFTQGAGLSGNRKTKPCFRECRSAFPD